MTANLQVVPKQPEDETLSKRVKHSRGCDLVTCSKCGGTASTEIKIGRRRDANGKPVGGTKQDVCAICMTKGDIVPMN